MRTRPGDGDRLSADLVVRIADPSGQVDRERGGGRVLDGIEHRLDLNLLIVVHTGDGDLVEHLGVALGGDHRFRRRGLPVDLPVVVDRQRQFGVTVEQPGHGRCRSFGDVARRRRRLGQPVVPDPNVGDLDQRRRRGERLVVTARTGQPERCPSNRVAGHAIELADPHGAERGILATISLCNLRGASHDHGLLPFIHRTQHSSAGWADDRNAVAHRLGAVDDVHPQVRLAVAAGERSWEAVVGQLLVKGVVVEAVDGHVRLQSRWSENGLAVSNRVPGGIAQGPLGVDDPAVNARMRCGRVEGPSPVAAGVLHHRPGEHRCSSHRTRRAGLVAVEGPHPTATVRQTEVGTARRVGQPDRVGRRTRQTEL